MPSIGKDLFLISKDEKINSRIIKKLIENDYTITTSSSVEKGLGKVYETPPALILIHESLLKGKALKFLKSF